ncbi:MAG: hypothetical protein IJM90_01750 [Firmicutes bacterium]|nr:hypothetical protein [Bacillota bacterium]
MFAYETHLHTFESSKCGATPGSEYPAVFQKLGYDGIFITDHFYHGNTRPDRTLPWPEYVSAYMRGYEEAKRAGDAIGFKVFFGIEENFEGDEYLIYGVGKDFLLAYPDIPGWTREQMTERVHAAGGAVIQAHPFRNRSYITGIHLFPEGVEGIEGINTANTPEDNFAALCYAAKFRLPIIAGSDTHNKSRINDRNGGIVYEEKPLLSSEDFAKRLRAGDFPRIFYPEDLFDGLDEVKVTLPAEICRASEWKALSPEEIEAWIRQGCRLSGSAAVPPSDAAGHLIAELSGAAVFHGHNQ